jgi:hypothetical protein
VIRIASSWLAGALACISAAAFGAQAPDEYSPSAPISSGAPADSLGTPLLPEQLEGIFLAACFDGAITLPAGEETPVTLEDLPRDLRRRFGTPVSGNVWRLNSTTPTYLFTMNFEPAPGTIPKVCGLITQSIKIGPAIQFLGSRVNGPSLDSFHESFTGAEWLSAEGGYVAVASKIDNFTVLALKILSKDQQRRALKLVPTLNQGYPAQ